VVEIGDLVVPQDVVGHGHGASVEEEPQHPVVVQEIRIPGAGLGRHELGIVERGDAGPTEPHVVDQARGDVADHPGVLGVHRSRGTVDARSPREEGAERQREWKRTCDDLAGSCETIERPSAPHPSTDGVSGNRLEKFP
jgi:hypothetical protein